MKPYKKSPATPTFNGIPETRIFVLDKNIYPKLDEIDLTLEPVKTKVKKLTRKPKRSIKNVLKDLR